MPSLQQIDDTGMAALARAGVPAAAARQQMALLCAAELRGHASHGLLRLPRVIERVRAGLADPAARGHHQWRGTALLEVDGARGLGPVVANHAIEALCARVGDTGIAAAAIRDCEHLGMLAHYAEAVAARGKVLLALTISEALVHPEGGREALLGTNPIAIGVPAVPHPFVLDMATSIVSMGKVHDHANRGAPLELGWALDAAGEPTVDAEAAKAGAIAPFGGAKGYALGLAFEVLVGALTACALGPKVRGTLDSHSPCNKGDLFIVLEPAAQAGARVSAFLDLVRASRPADPARPVRIPGDGARTRADARHEAEIPLPHALWDRLRALAGEV